MNTRRLGTAEIKGLLVEPTTNLVMNLLIWLK